MQIDVKAAKNVHLNEKNLSMRGFSRTERGYNRTLNTFIDIFGYFKNYLIFLLSINSPFG